MKCPVCDGASPRASDKVERRGFLQELFFFEFSGNVAEIPPEVERRVISGVTTVPLAMRFTNPNSGTTIETHYCFDRQALVFTITGRAPTDDRELNEFLSFCKEAFRQAEPRGRKRKLTVKQIKDCIQRAGRSVTLEDVASALKVDEETVRRTLPKGTTFTRFKKQVHG